MQSTNPFDVSSTTTTFRHSYSLEIGIADWPLAGHTGRQQLLD